MNWTILPGQKKRNTDRNTKLKGGFQIYTEKHSQEKNYFALFIFNDR